MRRSARRGLSAPACLLVLGLLAAACQPSQWALGQNDVNAVPVSSLAQGGTLNWPVQQFPSNYNGNASSGASGDEAQILDALMPQVFTFNASAQPVLDTDYVTSAKLTGTSPMVVTYNINPKATWNDGSPITEADFAAQWQALNGTNTAYNAASTVGYSQISSVAAGSSPHQVVVTFSAPFAGWQALFSPLYPAALNSSPTTFNGGWITGTAVSAGPFKFSGFDASAQSVTIVRDPHWWGAKPVLDSIVFHTVGTASSAQLDALKSGEVDLATITPVESQVKAAEALKNVTVRSAGGPELRQLTLNARSPNLTDVRVREAIGLALDRPAIAKALLGPLGVPDSDLNNHIYLTNESGYQDNAGQFATADLTKAGNLLDQAGWKLSGGIRRKNGQPLELRLLISADALQGPEEANLVQSQLKAVGIQAEIQSVPVAQFFPAYLQPGDFDLAIFSWFDSDFPIISNAPIYLSPTQGPGGTVNVGSNYAEIGTPSIDQLFAEAAIELNPTRQAQLGNQIDRAIWQEVHSLPLYQRPEIVAEKSTLANYGAFGFASPDYETMGFTK